MVGALPPLHELTKNVAVRLPEFLGTMSEPDAANGSGEPPREEAPEATPTPTD